MTPHHLKIIQEIGRNEAYEALVALSKELASLWAEQSKSKTTEWSFLSESLLREGQLEGVKSLLASIQKMAGTK